MNTTYQTLIVKFSEPIAALDGIFDDAQARGTDTLKGWIDDYESTRFTATDSHTAVITSEYNMECVKEWLQRQTIIAHLFQRLAKFAFQLMRMRNLDPDMPIGFRQTDEIG